MNNIVTSTEIYGVICKVLNGLDQNILKRGEKTAYALLHMLQVEGKYSEQDRIKFAIVALLQDVAMVKFGCKNSDNWLEYSVFSYVFLKHLSPVGEYADIIQYHDMEYSIQRKFRCRHPKVCEYLCVADDVSDFIEFYNLGYDSQRMMEETHGKYSIEAIELLLKCQEEYGIFSHIGDIDFHSHVVEDASKMLLTEDDTKRVLEMLVYLIDLKSRQTSLHSFSVAEFAMEIGEQMKLEDDDIEKLYYGALLHDIGKINIKSEILEAPRDLTKEEMEVMKRHAVETERILEGVVSDEIKNIAARHHEKLDGTGYPRGLKGEDLTRLQRIIVVSDILSALSERRSYKMPFTKIKVKNILKAEAKGGKICPKVTAVVLENYTSILADGLHKIKLTKKQHKLMMDEKNYLTLRIMKKYKENKESATL